LEFVELKDNQGQKLIAIFLDFNVEKVSRGKDREGTREKGTGKV